MLAMMKKIIPDTAVIIEACSPMTKAAMVIVTK